MDGLSGAPIGSPRALGASLRMEDEAGKRAAHGDSVADLKKVAALAAASKL